MNLAARKGGGEFIGSPFDASFQRVERPEDEDLPEDEDPSTQGHGARDQAAHVAVKNGRIAGGERE